jgi:DNA-binding NarL/FixJ family response regulator
VVVVPAASPVARARAANSPGPIRAIVIDREPLFTAALASLLAAPPLTAQVFSESRSDRALETVRQSGVELVFCDVKASPLSGCELAEALKDASPQVRVILLGDQDDAEWLVAAVSSNAAGVFMKDASLDEFLVGVQAVLSGHRAIGAGLIASLLERLSHPQRQSSQLGGRQLSRTELEILAMIGHAQSIRSIALSRGISHKTVRNHLAKIYRKLELHSRTEAMLWAARQGLTTGGIQ